MSGVEESRALRDAAAVEPLGEGRYGASISSLYTVPGGRPNGGYLQCLMASGALAAASDHGAPHLHVTSITSNYSGSPSIGPAELCTDVRRVGRSVSFVHVTLVQGGEVSVESIATIGTLHEDTVARYSDAPVFDIAALEDCVAPGNDETVEVRNLVDYRHDPSDPVWWKGETSDRGDVRGWLRLNDGGPPWDPWSLLFASDAMIPATFPLGSSGWVPTLQLTTYVRQIPTSEWLRGRQWCILIADGLVDERCELFDDRGALVASSSQLAMVRFPKGH